MSGWNLSPNFTTEDIVNDIVLSSREGKTQKMEMELCESFCLVSLSLETNSSMSFSLIDQKDSKLR